VTDSHVDPAQDPIDRFLNQRINLPPDEKARQGLLGETCQVLRRRRRWRRAGYVAVLVACYGAGVLTMRAWHSTPQPTVDLAQSQGGKSVKTEETTRASQESSTTASLPLLDDPDVPVTVVERIAAQSTDQRSQLYRRAGDRYLVDMGDIESAMRCYRRALDTGREQELVVASDDNWLLIALKQARQKEKDHGKSAG
jgi:hypothetical protein